MSENVTTVGWMAPLVNPISEDQREDVCEKLYTVGSSVCINYEGTLAYTQFKTDEYGLRFYINAPKSDLDEFDNLSDQFDLDVDKSKAKKFVCTWYNGADSDMDMLTLEEFYAS